MRRNIKLNALTEHITNRECPEIYKNIMNKLFYKVSEMMQNDAIKYNKDIYKYNAEIINKLRLQYNSVIYLTYRPDIDPLNIHNSLFDITSINCIIRTIFENYLIYHYIYIEHKRTKKDFELDHIISDNEFIQFKYNFFDYNSKYQLYNSTKIVKKKEIEEAFNNAKEVLLKDVVFKKLNKQFRNNIIKNGWKPKWKKMIEYSELNYKYALWSYDQLSLYIHSTSVAINTITYFHNNQFIYDKDAINCFLYSMLSDFVQDVMSFWKINKSVYTEDEFNLMYEFFCLGKYGTEQMPLTPAST